MDYPQVISRDRVAGRPQGAARQGEGIHPAARRAERPAPQAADGQDRQGLHLRGPGREAAPARLFDGRRQLIVYHFMFDPELGRGLPECSFLVDNIGHLAHLHARDTSLAVVSRAPLAKIEAYKADGLELPLVLLVRQRLQLRLPCHAGRERRARRIQLQGQGRARERRHALVHEGRVAGLERFSASGRRRLSHLLDLCARRRSA